MHCLGVVQHHQEGQCGLTVGVAAKARSILVSSTHVCGEPRVRGIDLEQLLEMMSLEIDANGTLRRDAARGQ